MYPRAHRESLFLLPSGSEIKEAVAKEFGIVRVCNACFYCPIGSICDRHRVFEWLTN